MAKRYLTLAGLAALAGISHAQMVDVPPGHWAEGAVRALLERGILTGFPDGTFKGTRAVSRYEAATMLYRAYLTWLEEVLSKVRATLEEQGLAPERVAEVYAQVAELQEVMPEVQKALEEYGVRLEALEADLEEVRQGLLAALEAKGDLEALSKGVRALEGRVAALEAALGEHRARLQALEARLQAAERAVEELVREVRGNEEARVKDAQATGKRLYALEEKTKALESAVQARPKGEVYAGVGEEGPFGGLALAWGNAEARLGTDGAHARLREGGLELAFKEARGRREAKARYSLFEGIRLVGELGAGEGGYLFGAFYVVHDPRGGLLPGVHAQVGAGAGLVGGQPGRYWLEAQGGALLGPVDLTLGYGRYWGLGGEDTPLSALFATVATGGEVAGALRLAYAVPGEDIGRDNALAVEASLEGRLAPFRVRVMAGYRDGLLGSGVASHVDRYRFTTATGFYGGVRVAYEVRF
jgi:hypothetical protein